jgi:hypothetical protein
VNGYDPEYKHVPNVYELAIEEIGGDKQFCYIYFWDNRNAIPLRADCPRSSPAAVATA